LEELRKELKQLNIKIDNFKEEVAKNRSQMLQRIEETIKTQEEIIMDMIKKFNDEFYQHKTNVLGELEHLKNQQDVLKISYAVNENKLIEKIEKIVIRKVQDKIDGRENEILMKIWIVFIIEASIVLIFISLILLIITLIIKILSNINSDFLDLIGIILILLIGIGCISIFFVLVR